MIQLTYLFHSGFVLETDRCILVFDYWLDPSGAMRRILRPNHAKPVYVFVSHYHEDHFSRSIFGWKKRCPSLRFTYLLSKDILQHRKAEAGAADAWLAKGDRWHDDNLRVTAAGSNDSGVSWIVEVDGRRIFHAGDLCNWYARFLQDDGPGKTICSEESGMYIRPVEEEKRFLDELQGIRETAASFDVAMFPVDGRIGNGYTRGARQFIDRFKVGLFVPMHFVMSGFESAWRMQPFCREKETPFWCIAQEGESIALSGPTLIRRTTKADLPQLKAIFARARRFMAETGNPHQWVGDYPSDELLLNDMESGDSYLLQQGNDAVGTFVLRSGADPTYRVIYDGAWPNDRPYATIHRIAGNGKAKGLLHTAVRFALMRHHAIRIDTHRDNRVMQNAVRKEGFRYCGIIHCWNGSERLAYQLTQETAP